MPRPTLVTIEQETAHLAELKAERENQSESGKTLTASQQIKRDIRIEFRHQQLRKMKQYHDLLYRERLPRISVLVALDRPSREYVIRVQRAGALALLAAQQRDGDAYAARHARLILQRIELIAQAFSELDAQEEIFPAILHEDHNSEMLPLSLAAEILEYRNLPSNSEVTYGPSLPADELEEIMTGINDLFASQNIDIDP